MDKTDAPKKAEQGVIIVAKLYKLLLLLLHSARHFPSTVQLQQLEQRSLWLLTAQAAEYSRLVSNVAPYCDHLNKTNYLHLVQHVTVDEHWTACSSHGVHQLAFSLTTSWLHSFPWKPLGLARSNPSVCNRQCPKSIFHSWYVLQCLAPWINTNIVHDECSFLIMNVLVTVTAEAAATQNVCLHVCVAVLPHADTAPSCFPHFSCWLPS